MTQNTFTTMIRGFEVTVEAGDTENVYKVHVVEGDGVPWTAELPIDLDGFVGENEDLDGSNELLTFVAEAAVDLFESSRDTLGQGAGALEVAAMKKRSQNIVIGCMSTPWQDYYLQLKDTPFAGKAEELIKQYLELSLEEPCFEKPELDELRKEKQQLIYDLNMLELDLLKSSPEQQMILIVGSRKRAYLGEVDIPLYLDIFAGSPLESEAVNILKGILDIEERIQSLEDSEDYTAHWKRLNSIEMQLQDLILTAVGQNAPLGCPTGMDSAPNMANDIAELMEGVDLHTPLSARKRAQELGGTDEITSIHVIPGWDLIPGMRDADIKEYLEGKYPQAEISIGAPRQQTTRVRVTDADIGRQDLDEVVLSQMLLDLGREAAGYGAAPDINEYAQKAQDRAFGPLPVKSSSRRALARKRAQEIRTEGMWDYTEEFQMSNPIVAGRPVRLRKPHDESWIEAARHSMCVMEVSDPKMSEQKGRGQGSGWMDLQTIRTDDIDYLPPEYAALFDSEMPPSIFDEDEADPAFRTSRHAFEEFETAEDRETEGGEIRHDLDTGCIDPEDYKFEPNQKVTLNKKLELVIGGGVPKNYDKGTPCVVESRYDGEGDFYYVRFEDGQMARVLFSDLTGGKKKEGHLFTTYDYMDCLLQLP